MPLKLVIAVSNPSMCCVAQGASACLLSPQMRQEMLG